MSVAHVYTRNHINTDEIIPARYLNTDDRVELAKHCMEDLDKDFVNKVKDGDVIVAGEDFGCGSSREHAVWAIHGAGIQTVIAKSFARIFYRNAINNGFYLIESPDTLEIITCHNYNKKSLFEKSLDYAGIENYTVLHQKLDQPWRNTLKLKWVLHHLESNPNGPENVLFCDADDCILIDDP